jgi:hypothetical protein
MTTMNDDWIEWVYTPEKPYPETLETKVLVQFLDGFCNDLPPHTVEYWHDDGPDLSNWHQDGLGDAEIVAYKVVS